MEMQAKVDRQSEVQSEVAHEHGEVGGRLRGCQGVSRSIGVSRSEWVSRSGQVIRGMNRSNQVSKWTIRHDEWRQRGVGRSGQMQRGETFSL